MGSLLGIYAVPSSNLVAPVLTMAVPQTTYPPKVNAVFDITNLTTDTVNIQVATDLAFTSLVSVTNPSIPIGSSAQTFGLTGITSGKHYFRQWISRGGISSPMSNVVTHGDTVAPVLSSPTGTATGGSTAAIGATTSKGEGIVYWTVLPATSPAPTVNQFLAGNTGGLSSGSHTAVAGVNSFTATGMGEAQNYKAYFFQVDLANNRSTIVGSATFTTQDVSAPVLSNPTAANGGALSVTTDHPTGTLYWYVWASASPPTLANMHSGSGSVAHGSVAISAPGTYNFLATGITPDGNYYAHFQQTSGTGHESAFVTSPQFSSIPDPAKLSTVTGANKSGYITVDSTGLIATSAATGATNMVRANRTGRNGKIVYEVTLTSIGSDHWLIGFDDGVISLNPFSCPALGDTHGVLAYGDSTAALVIYYNGAVQSPTITPPVNGDTISAVYDPSGVVQWYLTHSGTSTLLATQSITPFTNVYALLGDKHIATLTSNFGATAFARTLGPGEERY